MSKREDEGYLLIDDIDRIVKNLTTLRKDDNYTLIAASYKLVELQTENDLLRQALESATNWLERAAMGCHVDATASEREQGASQYNDAAWRARKVLNTAIRVNRIPTEVATMREQQKECNG